MSAPSTTDQPGGTPRVHGGRSLILKAVATTAAVAALVFGANAITKGDSSSAAATGGQGAPAAAGGGMRATPPQMGTAVSGATLARLEAVATARYPGTVERATQLADGSYVVHVIKSGGSGEVHVLVSKAFKITGVEQGGPPG